MPTKKRSGTPNDERGVFINCPFDAQYQPLFRALLFAVEDCGFRVPPVFQPLLQLTRCQRRNAPFSIGYQSRRRIESGG